MRQGLFIKVTFASDLLQSVHPVPKIGRVGILYQKQKSILNVSHKGARIFPD